MTITERVPNQTSLDDPGRPIIEETFCVLDVETTGGSADEGAITEIGAVLVRGGVCEGTWSSLIDPGQSIPAWITALTGIQAATVAEAPPFRTVIDDLVRFIGDAVIVGHNVRYDLGFLAAEFERAGHARLANPSVCTLALARRLLRDEVPNFSLGTLADCLGLDHQPSHRALDDVLATVDLLWVLLERAGTWGVLGIEDLFVLPRLAGHPQAAKLRLTDALPHSPGVYLFRDRAGNVLYVGKATDLRARVRSYFGRDDRRKITALLRETATIDHEVCVHPLAAAVREVQLISEYLPRYNSHSTRWRSMAYLGLTNEAFPRFTVTRSAPPDGMVLGPLTSQSAARRVIDAVTTVVPLRRCTAKIPAGGVANGQLSFDEIDSSGPNRPGGTPCLAAQLGVACCPCSGDTSPAVYARHVDTIRRGLGAEPELLLHPLRERLNALSEQQRFEEAAELRDRAAALADSLRRQRRLETWRRAERVVVSREDGSGAELSYGLLHRVWGPQSPPEELELPPVSATGPIPREQIYERLCIVAELERARSPWRIEHVDGPLAEPVGRIDRFETRGGPRQRPGR